MTIPSSIKNIIFDFGGVILNIDYKLTEIAFAKLGLPDFSNIYSQKNQKELFDLFEKGLITPADFRREVKKYSKQEISDTQIDIAWNAMLLDLPVERVQLLDKLKRTHRVFLLSNTNEIHFTAFSSYMKDKFKRNVFSDVFERYYVSHKVKMRKPDAEIFEMVVQENMLRKEETLFIDDSMQHIEGARKAGLNAIFLEKGKTILDIFNE
ncbi:MAG: HAD family phosphatase [Bacteroidetes bacterium]|nr:HAD family phosphatase [Bacteroidota bacterium]